MKITNKYKNINDNNFHYPEKKQLISPELSYVKKLAELDSQIDTSGVFRKFTDFQNIMFSDISLLELLWTGEETELAGKNIGTLYIENLNDVDVKNIQYDKLVFDCVTMLEMTQIESRSEYRSKVLGKMVRYGFSDIKIKQMISGEKSFDAFVLEDLEGNIMVYFPCTNLIEPEDYLYDSYPIIDSISKKGKIIGSLITAKKIYESQQQQAKKLLKRCIEETDKNKKIFVSGFSLGGGLAEAAYLHNYKENSNKLGDIILFNPYHDRISTEEANILKKKDNLKIYVCEGDSASTVFNYEELSEVSKPVYINYKENVFQTINDVNNGNSLISEVVNHFKNSYCEKIISKCNIAKRNNKLFDWPLNLIIKDMESIKQSNINAINLVEKLKSVSKKIEQKGKLLGERYNLAFLENIQYIEYIFTSTHLTYTIDTHKNISFDDKGKIKATIDIGNKKHIVRYPSFDETSSNFLGSNIYKELLAIVKDIENK